MDKNEIIYLIKNFKGSSVCLLINTILNMRDNDNVLDGIAFKVFDFDFSFNVVGEDNHPILFICDSFEILATHSKNKMFINDRIFGNKEESVSILIRDTILKQIESKEI